MRRLAILACSWIWILSCAAQDQGSLDTIALEDRFQQVAANKNLWPRFEPLVVPLAVFDGQETYLFRHPDPPEGFTARGDALVFPGRYPDVVAHSSAMIGGIATATMLLNEPIEAERLDDLAAIVAHEAFHVYQSTTARGWGADESQLFLYPIDDADLLARRRLENEALRRAIRADDDRMAAGWARQALELRRSRFSSMNPGVRDYERGIEAKEGTAYYVELRAAGRWEPEFPADGFPVEAVRRRAYETGVAWALLLDRFQPDWREGFAESEERLLDSDLEMALANIESSPDCAFTVLDRAAALEAAKRDVADLHAARVRMQERIESASGWRIVVEAEPAEPLWPQGFDPMNVRKLDTGLLHTRFLKLGNGAGILEVVGDTVLTQGIGSHPLYNGVRRATMAGIDSEPRIQAEGDSVTIVTSTIRIGFRGAGVSTAGQEITVRLGAGSGGENR